MVELAVLALLVSAVVYFIFPRKRVPVVACREGDFHLVVVPHLVGQQVLIEAIARRIMALGLPEGDSATLSFEISDAAHPPWLLGVTRRGGRLYLQAIEFVPPVRDDDPSSAKEAVERFAAEVLVNVPPGRSEAAIESPITDVVQSCAASHQYAARHLVS